MSSSQYDVLLADGSYTHLMLMEMLLADLPTVVTPVQTGREVMQHLSQNTPDLIVMDLTLPLVSGLDLCGRVKSLPRFKKTPIVLVVESPDERTLEMTRLVKADAVIEKPLASKGFRQIVATLLREPENLAARVILNRSNVQPYGNEIAAEPPIPVLN